MTARADGSFEVKLLPQSSDAPPEGAPIGRFSIDKQFRGDIEGTSTGEMLSGGDPTSGSAGYVAIERVVGTLHGRRGSFILQHAGTMTPASSLLTIDVVPGSGTGELAALTGSMTLVIADGRHSYTFHYSLGHDAVR